MNKVIVVLVGVVFVFLAECSHQDSGKSDSERRKNIMGNGEMHLPNPKDYK